MPLRANPTRVQYEKEKKDNPSKGPIPLKGRNNTIKEENNPTKG